MIYRSISLRWFKLDSIVHSSEDDVQNLDGKEVFLYVDEFKLAQHIILEKLFRWSKYNLNKIQYTKRSETISFFVNNLQCILELSI